LFVVIAWLLFALSPLTATLLTKSCEEPLLKKRCSNVKLIGALQKSVDSLQEKFSRDYKESLVTLPDFVYEDNYPLHGYCNIMRYNLKEFNRTTAANGNEHMIITCPYKKDIWIKLLKAFIASPNNPRLHQLYHDMLTLDFTCYTLLKLDLHCSIFDILSTTIRFVWRSHRQFMFEGIPIEECNIFENICKELCKISSYQSSS
jgi:hypothetical protein